MIRAVSSVPPPGLVGTMISTVLFVAHACCACAVEQARYTTAATKPATRAFPSQSRRQKRNLTQGITVLSPQQRGESILRLDSGRFHRLCPAFDIRCDESLELFGRAAARLGV